MNQFSAEQIQETFEKLPPRLQAAISSPEIHEKIMEIGRKHNLHIDQIGELVDEIGLVMLGLKKASNFVSDASSRLSIGNREAQAIADEINSDIFSAIKSSMQNIEDEAEKNATNDADISALERAGGFDVESSMASSSADGQETPDYPGNGQVSEADKDEILSGIEDPRPSAPSTNNHVEPMVDHLLTNMSGQTEVKTEHKEASAPPNLPIVGELPPESDHIPAKATFQAPKPKGPDPYKEPLE